LHRNMALTQRLEFRQSQALVMTPQLMQAIKLLQLSNLDLAAYVEGELEKNPLLERPSEGPGETNQPGEGAAAGAMAGSGEAPDGEWAKADVKITSSCLCRPATAERCKFNSSQFSRVLFD